MTRGLFEEFLGEIKKGLHEKSHPLNRLKEEKRLLLAALKRLEGELSYISVHGNWDEGVDSLYYLRNFAVHNRKLSHCKAYFNDTQDIYFLSLMEGEQEEIMSSLEELIHIFRRDDYSEVEKTWRIKSLEKLIIDQDKREKIFYGMLEEALSQAEWRELAKVFEDIGYLMGEVEAFNPTISQVNQGLSLEEASAIFMSLPIKIIYKNREGEIILIKDLPPDIEVEWTELSNGGRLYYELKEK